MVALAGERVECPPIAHGCRAAEHVSGCPQGLGSEWMRMMVPCEQNWTQRMYTCNDIPPGWACTPGARVLLAGDLDGACAPPVGTPGLGPRARGEPCSRGGRTCHMRKALAYRREVARFEKGGCSLTDGKVLGFGRGGRAA